MLQRASAFTPVRTSVCLIHIYVIGLHLALISAWMRTCLCHVAGSCHATGRSENTVQYSITASMCLGSVSRSVVEYMEHDSQRRLARTFRSHEVVDGCRPRALTMCMAEGNQVRHLSVAISTAANSSNWWLCNQNTNPNTPLCWHCTEMISNTNSAKSGAAHDLQMLLDRHLAFSSVIAAQPASSSKCSHRCMYLDCKALHG